MRRSGRSTSQLTIRVPATSTNLGPAFDCLALALAIYNTFTVTPAHRSSISVAGEGAGVLHTDERNLFFRAYQAAAAAAGQQAPTAAVRAHNRIPIARGLGTSAAAIVAGTLVANELLSLHWTAAELARVALSLEAHPDNIVGALCGGLTASFSDAEDVRWVKLDAPKGIQVVLAVPEYELDTQYARSVLPEAVPFADAAGNVARAVLLTAALATGDAQSVRGMMSDRLHQPYRAPITPGAREAIAAARDAGALDAAVSGAGPTVIAFATDGETRIQRAMQAAFASLDIEARCFVADVDADGATVNWQEEA